MFLTTLGVDWEYEPEGFALPSGRYLPDFRVWDESQYSGFYWIECKPKQPQIKKIYKDELTKTKDYIEKIPREVALARELSGATKAGVLFLSGDTFDLIRLLYAECLQFLRDYGYADNVVNKTELFLYVRFGRSMTAQFWDKPSALDREFFFPMGTNFYEELLPKWMVGPAFKAANAALSARFEHGEVVR